MALPEFYYFGGPKLFFIMLFRGPEIHPFQPHNEDPNSPQVQTISGPFLHHFGVPKYTKNTPKFDAAAISGPLTYVFRGPEISNYHQPIYCSIGAFISQSSGVVGGRPHFGGPK